MFDLLDLRTGQGGSDWTEPVWMRTPLWVGPSLLGRSYTSVLMLQLRVNMSLMVSERARLGLR